MNYFSVYNLGLIAIGVPFVTWLFFFRNASPRKQGKLPSELTIGMIAGAIAWFVVAPITATLAGISLIGAPLSAFSLSLQFVCALIGFLAGVIAARLVINI